MVILSGNSELSDLLFKHPGQSYYAYILVTWLQLHSKVKIKSSLFRCLIARGGKKRYFMSLFSVVSLFAFYFMSKKLILILILVQTRCIFT